MIRDGDGVDKPSTNGTWLFAEEEIKIEGDTLIKAGNGILKLAFIP